MKLIFYTQDKQEVHISEKPLGRGGEGNVYEVINRKGYVAKIYHAQERKKEREQKLTYLIQNPPELKDVFSVIWVEELLYKEGVFVGFLMKKARGSYDLTSLSSLKTSDKLNEAWKQKFTRHNSTGFANRARLCYNLAVAFHQLHQTEKYVVVDIKPENIKIKLNGEVSLIDIDSVAVIDQGKQLFAPEKITNEYCPPEFQTLDFKKELVSQTWDRFSMAIVFYKVLFGLHPFAVTGGEKYQNMVSHEQKINAGLFPFGSKSHELKIIPKPHTNFWALPEKIQNLFMRCFDEGGHTPSMRPSAEDWCEAFAHFQPKVAYYNNPMVPRPKKKKQEFQRRVKKQIRETSVNIQVEPRQVAILVIVTLIVSCLGWFTYSLFSKKAASYKTNIYKEMKKEARERASRKSIKDVLTESESQDDSKYDFSDDEFPHGFARVVKDGKWGYINTSFEEVIPLQFEKAEPFENRMAKVKMDGKWGYLNIEGDVSVPIEYDQIYRASDGSFRFQQEGKWGCMDKRRNEIVPALYDDIGVLSDGMASVKLDDKYGYVNRYGEEVIPVQFDKAEDFKDGDARVTLAGDRFYINYDGICVALCPD